ncbi:MAG TPA: hypothetical protein VLX68_09045 [Chitinivibrionales bacterium]|nr:hypothetical protein [Chitinivibrionales bacterium]
MKIQTVLKHKNLGAPPRSAATVLLPGSAIRLVTGPPEVAFGEGTAGNSLLLTLQSNLARG